MGVYKPKTSRRETSPTCRADVIGYWRTGYSIPQIVELEYLPRSTIRSIIDRFEERGRASYYNKPRPGPKLKTTDRDNRALLRAANEDTRATLHALAIPSKSTKQLGRNLVRKILKNAGKSKRRPRKKPFLKSEHKGGRTVWCKDEKRIKRDYNKVCWSDEVTFHIRADGSIFNVTRGAGEEYLEKNLKPSFKSGRTTVGVWSCFYGDRMGPLVIIEKGGRMTAKRYLETLKEHFIPFYERIVEKYGPDVVM